MTKPEGPTSRRILLVRHGHYRRTPNHTDESWDLSPLGRRQSARVGKRLVKLVQAAPGRFEGIYASPWRRAIATAEIAARQMDIDRIRVKPYLHECLPVLDPGREDLQRLHPELKPLESHQREAVENQLERVHERFLQAPNRSSKVVVFTHGNLIRYLIARILGLPLNAWMMMDIAHCSLTEIRVYAGGFKALISYNGTGHLTPGSITTS